jgi:hypothetical protein
VLCLLLLSAMLAFEEKGNEEALSPSRLVLGSVGRCFLVALFLLSFFPASGGAQWGVTLRSKVGCERVKPYVHLQVC